MFRYKNIESVRIFLNFGSGSGIFSLDLIISGQF